MNNNNLVEGGHGHGAIKTDKNVNIPKFNEVAKDTAPFDWNTGYDVCDLLQEHCGISDTPTNDQNGSMSCGGQMYSQIAQTILGIIRGVFNRKSAKFVYAPIAAPGGGSTEGDLINRGINVGVADEVLCQSYENGQPPTEVFMTNVSDITPEAIANAELSKAYMPVYIDTTNIDELAQAARDHYCGGIGLEGQNNGTWESQFPNPPSLPPNDPSFWGHWLYYAKAKMINSSKKIGFKNSWGSNVGINGWQFIGEEYLPYVFSAFAIVYMGSTEGFSHNFQTNMSFGNSGPEVSALQEALKNDGTFPVGQAITGYFGQITLTAVKAYQLKNKLPTTGFVGPLTRGCLNIEFNH